MKISPMATSTKTKTQKGSINVTTENIFPIIKKFLYSDHEIFLRELVSNAVDATQKRKTISKSGEVEAFGNDNPQVHVNLDKEAKTITISDNGIGMTGDEIDKYINQIAFSGATEFLDKYKDDDAKQAIIGHFGLGFYSSFMVAERVDIVSLSAKKGSKAVKWSCDGSPDYTIDPADKKEAGTDIVLHVSEDSLEFLEDERLGGILNKYCKFMPVDIVFGTRTVEEEDPSGDKDEEGNVKKVSTEVPHILNNTDPAWMKKPADLTEEAYAGFYRELYPMNMEDPLFNIHLNVDFPFNLTGILYFPPLKKTMEMQKNKIHLYSNQVFITDNVENIVPDFLTMLHGVIDSPDIPLNVSRSYLQEDANVKKISGYISKKVADRLASMFKDDRESFEKQWDDLRIFVEYGILTDEKFSERSKKFYLYKDTDGKCMTHEELLTSVGETQKEMFNVLDDIKEVMPENKPRYLMGVGTPADILGAVKRGIDMFDCVMPTRNARNGMLFTSEGFINIKNKKWAEDFSPIDPNGTSYVDSFYNKAYLRHLVISKEILGAQIASIHNLSFYVWLVKEARKHIIAGDFHPWKTEMVRKMATRL